MEINRADYEMLLRVPGIGVRSARRICSARRFGRLRAEDLPKIGVVLKRAQFFITVDGVYLAGRRISAAHLRQCLTAGKGGPGDQWWQPVLFDWQPA